MKPAIIYTDAFVSVTFPEQGKHAIIQREDERYDRVLQAVGDENYGALYEIIFPEAKVEILSNGDIKIVDGVVTYQDQPMHNIVASRIMEFANQKLPYKHLAAFLDNILSASAAIFAGRNGMMILDELYEFLETNETMPITEDGAFLAYRVIGNDYLSKHANPDGSRNRNFVGDVVEIPRHQVDTERTRTCSNGLHFCSYTYVPEYGYSGDDRVVIVKIFPQDVVSIPTDYNYAKGRCCRYEVVGEVENYERNSDEFRARAENQLNELAQSEETLSEEQQEQVAKAVEDVELVDLTDEEIGNKFDLTGEQVEKIESAIERAIQRALEKNGGWPRWPTVHAIAKNLPVRITCEKLISLAEELRFSVIPADSFSKSQIAW